VITIVISNAEESFLRLKKGIVGNLNGGLAKRLEPVPAVPVGTDAHGIIYHPCSRWKLSGTLAGR